MGEITVTWLGPDWNNFLEIQAIHMLNAYLCDSPISILKKVFVEMNDPYCTEVDFRLHERSRMAITANFQNVPLEKADQIVPLLISTLHDIQSIDMDRMLTLIQKEKLKVKYTIVHNVDDNRTIFISFLMNMKLVQLI